MIVTVDREIVAKARPRVCKHGTFTPQKTKDYEQLIRNNYMAQDGTFFEKGIPVQISIKAYKKPPKSTTKKIGSQAFSGCSSLQSIEIPNSIMEIGESANCQTISSRKDGALTVFLVAICGCLVVVQ